jgi:hypothetical protein
MKNTFLRPPHGCPCSKHGHYWCLLQPLYGPIHAPKFDMLSSHLTSTGLHASKTSPCLFMRTLIDGEPPIYVADIIYFSASSAVE